MWTHFKFTQKQVCFSYFWPFAEHLFTSNLKNDAVEKKNQGSTNIIIIKSPHRLINNSDKIKRTEKSLKRVHSIKYGWSVTVLPNWWRTECCADDPVTQNTQNYAGTGNKPEKNYKDKNVGSRAVLLQIAENEAKAFIRLLSFYCPLIIHYEFISLNQPHWIMSQNSNCAVQPLLLSVASPLMLMPPQFYVNGLSFPWCLFSGSPVPPHTQMEVTVSI